MTECADGKCQWCGKNLRTGKYWCSTECRFSEKRNKYNKFCPSCEVMKSKKEFARSNLQVSGCQVYCDVCRHFKNKKSYAKRKHIIAEVSARYRFKNKLELIKLLGGECVVCGDKSLYHLQVDHVNNNGSECLKKIYVKKRLPGAKRPVRLAVSALDYLNGKKDIAELQVLCANHNYEKEMKRRGYFNKLVNEINGE